MPGGDLAALGRRMDKLTAEVVGDKQLAKTVTAVGMMAKGQVSALSGGASLGGDLAFSGWRRSGPIPLQVAFKAHKAAGGLTIHRSGRSAGPWLVAEEGRHAAAGPPMRGPRLTKTGKVSKARVKRWNGRTDGKGSWTAYAAVVGPKVSGVVARETRAALSRAVTG